MNNSVTILDRNNQSIPVDLICYFSLNNKKYIFYNKNEIVQDGLIKMYVSEENNGINTDITQDEWNSLKKVMQDIITGSTNVTFINYSNPLVFNEAKAIALSDTNVNLIKSAYKNAVNVNLQEPVLNKDILAQNFGNNTEVFTTESNIPVQISNIPNVQNSFNMESTPVNMNMEVPTIEPISQVLETPSVPTIKPLNVVEEVPSVVENTPVEVPVLETVLNDNVPSIEPISELPSNNTLPGDLDMQPLNINAVKPGGIDSGFKVSNEPNIFDSPTVPFPISDEENNSASNQQSILAQGDSDNRIIEINNRRIKLFEELAQTYREENDLLNDKSTDLEKTASNLFDNNGALNINY